MKHSTFVIRLAGSLLLLAGTAGAQTPETAGYLDRFEGEFAKIQVNGHQQLLHRSGKVIVDKIQEVSSYRLVSAVKQGAYGVVDRKGDIIAPFRYDAVKVLGESNRENPGENYCLITVKLQGKTGAVDSLGKVLCQPEYSDIEVLTPKTFSIKKNGLYGWCDMKTGKLLQEPKYTEVSRSYVIDGLITIQSQGKNGLALEDGTVLVPPKYERFMGWDSQQLFSYYVPGGKCGLMDRQGKVLTPAIYDDINAGPSDALVAVKVQDKTGLLDVATGKLKTPLQYTRVDRLGPLFQVWKGNLCGLTDSMGKEVIPAVNTEIQLYDSKGHSVLGAIVSLGPSSAAYTPPYYAVAKKGATAAFYDASGKQLLPFDYSDIRLLPLHDKVYAALLKDTRCGLADLSGKIVMPVQFAGIDNNYGTSNYNDDAAGEEKNNFICVLKEVKKGEAGVGLFNIATGQLVIPAVYSGLRWQNADMIRLEQGDSSGLADKTGKIIRPLKKYGAFDAVSPQRIVEKRYADDGSTTLLTNKEGRVLYENKYWEFSPLSFNRLLTPEARKTWPLQFNSGLLKVKGYSRENQFVDTAGKPVVFDEYKYVGDFNNGIAVATTQDDRVGIISIDKKVVYPLVLDDLAPADDELLKMKQGKKAGMLRKDGSVFLPLEYDDIDRVYDTSLYIITRQGKKGVLNAEGKELVPAAYDEIRYNRDSRMFEVTKDNKAGLLGADGSTLVPAIYDDLDQNQAWGDNSPFPVLVKQGEWYLYLDAQGKPLPYRAKKKKGYND
ncbi:WG repeat-containing protein [Chitinophaga oryzae]|uniref:WG repeat-containing protein n=1 Tax=Chitinophaga oryzae TaxID=2725414 RepID=A0ABX6LFT3_9BACT|nr:WG repeat-containing protein [Chitinophaga oryzae]QJB38949.1 WG repeat-containing protein [Chitinophaga oryzae]